ncbi:hypothetical protein SASPL_118170 [Salvia splendens]|uniref:Uncharacterized protein n=1 Tax=Salvia splendens TaxID=180675 RepID=A0A8X8XWV2_SALSN|nr:hypothetical protein SASPL_118170 [Salvia splendens]
MTPPLCDAPSFVFKETTSGIGSNEAQPKRIGSPGRRRIQYFHGRNMPYVPNLEQIYDNVATNDVAMTYMHFKLNARNIFVTNGQYLHQQCVVSIIHLVIDEGLKEAVKWIKASPLKSLSFKEIAKISKVDTSKFLCMDVMTRWNSTYLMLEAAFPYEPAMRLFTTVNPDFASDLKEMKHKKNVLVELFDIISVITELEEDKDDSLRNMATRMRLNHPMQKMKHVEHCLKLVYGGTRPNELLEELIHDLYEVYKAEIDGSTLSWQRKKNSLGVVSNNVAYMSDQTELNRYLSDSLYMMP